MKTIIAIVVLLLFVADAEAQCFVQQRFIRQVVPSFVQQSLIVPQSTTFFSNGNSVFIERQPQIFFTNPLPAQFIVQDGFVPLIRRRSVRIISPGLVTIQ